MHQRLSVVGFGVRDKVLELCEVLLQQGVVTSKPHETLWEVDNIHSLKQSRTWSAVEDGFPLQGCWSAFMFVGSGKYTRNQEV